MKIESIKRCRKQLNQIKFIMPIYIIALELLGLFIGAFLADTIYGMVFGFPVMVLGVVIIIPTVIRYFQTKKLYLNLLNDAPYNLEININ